MSSSSHRGIGTFASQGSQHMDIGDSANPSAQGFAPLTASFRTSAAAAAQSAVDAVRGLSRSVSPTPSQTPGIRYGSGAPVQQSAGFERSGRPNRRGNRSRSADGDRSISSIRTTARQMGPQETMDFDEIFDNLTSRVTAAENNIRAHGRSIAEFQGQAI